MSAAPAQRAIVIEEISGGRYRIDLEALNIEVSPLEGGKYLIAPPVQDVVDGGGAGKWEKSIKQWLAARLKSTEGESRRVFEYAQKFTWGVFFGIGRLFLVLMVAAFMASLNVTDIFAERGTPTLFWMTFDARWMKTLAVEEHRDRAV